MHRGIYTILVGLMFVVPYVMGCSVLELGARATDTGDEFDTDERKVHYSSVVVYGEILENITSGDYPFQKVDGVYTVKFKVLCTYLGGPIDEIIYIAGIGNENGQISGCPAAPLGESTEAVMFLKRTTKPNVFETEFKPNVGETDIFLDDLSLVCGLQVDENSNEICQDFPPLLEEEGCIKWTPIVIEPEVTTMPAPEVEPTPEPEEEPKGDSSDTEKSDDTVVDIDTTNQSGDDGYKTKPETEKNPGPAAGSTGDGNGSSIVSASLLVSIISVFLNLVVR